MDEKPLTESFFERDTVTVARALLGKVLVREQGGHLCSGRIVETEAYRGEDDPASHAFRGRTPRNLLMFGSGGRAYVYFVYGRNWCLNVTTEAVGTPGAVLIRAIEPLEGLKLMMERRGMTGVKNLTNGPGKLTQALDVTGIQNGTNLTKRGSLYILGGSGRPKLEAIATRRIGIKEGRQYPWRFLVAENPFVSRPTRQ
jgi:DNA-3-methyladenine glycosylase